MKFELGQIRHMGHEVQSYRRNGYSLTAAWDSIYNRLTIRTSNPLFPLYEWTDLGEARELFEFLWTLVGNVGEDFAGIS